ncbi:Cyclohexadienyl dehydratase precursor [Serratia rubidaea]|uniref:Cyclohexadienyl dehydratase n=1 Tax=Serratia rubidaea TaxID=61652 RepID=A0A4U9HTV9_SERRU|nr:Cyclohexadienyl dehydratase precursor [Serratia rubidaea]
MMKKLAPLVLLAVAGGASAQSHLDKVTQQKKLEVCTTGDYKPYTFLPEKGDYEGIDIEMAQSLAKSLGAEVKWVKTSWKTLMQDFNAGKCDIAMGGISVTLERQKQAFFAEKLDTDGKIPLVRCSDVKKYRTIAQINKPSVRVIEPAGGTNEAFAPRAPAESEADAVARQYGDLPTAGRSQGRRDDHPTPLKRCISKSATRSCAPSTRKNPCSTARRLICCRATT